MKQAKTLSARLKSFFEFLAVVGPIICLVDCIVIPAALLLLPFFGMQNLCHGLSDQLLAFIVFGLCAPSLVPGYLKHRKIQVLAASVLGFTLIFFANFAGTQTDETVHRLITVAGCLVLIKANADNRKFSKCHCHSHGHENKAGKKPLVLAGSLNDRK